MSIPGGGPFFIANEEIRAKATACLIEQGFPPNMAREVVSCHEGIPLRIWIVDNSSSMNIEDGRKLVETTTKHDVRLVGCTRWEELKECVRYHAQMAALIRAPTRFLLLNPPSSKSIVVEKSSIKATPNREMTIAERGAESISQDLCNLNHSLNQTEPHGATPLARHLFHLYDSLSTRHLEHGQRIVLVLATDGKPTDDQGYCSAATDAEMEDALVQFESLPVWIVVRLCTNDSSVVRYYEELSKRLDHLNLEILDDYLAEAQEVHRYNPWLNYSLCLHRCREMGGHALLNALDKRSLTLDEVGQVAKWLFGGASSLEAADDFESFCQHMGRLVEKEESPWNPIHRKRLPWMNFRVLRRRYGPKPSSATFLFYTVLTLAVTIAVLRFWGGVPSPLWSNNFQLFIKNYINSYPSDGGCPLSVFRGALGSGVLFPHVGTPEDGCVVDCGDGSCNVPDCSDNDFPKLSRSEKSAANAVQEGCATMPAPITVPANRMKRRREFSLGTLCNWRT